MIWKGSSEWAPLPWAASKGELIWILLPVSGHLDCVKEILKLPGIDITEADTEGKSAISHAVEKGDYMHKPVGFNCPT